MSEQTQQKLLPLGSIVILDGSVKKLIIVSRGMIVENDYFEYGAVLYPEGLSEDSVAYFKPEDIFKVVHEGYQDDDEEVFVAQLLEAREEFLSSPEAAPELSQPVADEAPSLVEVVEEEIHIEKKPADRFAAFNEEDNK